jgi:protein involved in polysaccharide export with SLBB domain
MMRTLGTLLVAGLAGLGVLAPARADNAPMPLGAPPVASIRSPVDGAFFVVGRTLSLMSNASDRMEPPAALRYRWSVDLVHPAGVEKDFFTSSESNAFFAVEDLDEPNGVHLEIHLVVTNRAGLSDTALVRVYPKLDQEPANPVGPGDILDVTYYAGGEKQEEFSSEVSALGTITSPLVGELSVGGLTAGEVSDKLTVLLARDYFVNPQVLVGVRERAKKVYVGGEVKQPGAYSVREGSTVLNACILAGGFTDYAALNRVTVTRTVGKQVRIIKLDLKEVQKGRVSDVTLETGDRVDIPHRVF